MPSNRPNLILDEQAFQDLLSAAFTIQEHNDRMNQVRQTAIKSQVHSEVLSESEADSFCQHCGAPKPSKESGCRNCGEDEFRPGERMQRKWASMWLRSQEQGLWPERTAEAGEASQGIRKGPEKALRPLEAAAQPLVHSTRDSTANNFLAAPAAREMARKTTTTIKTTETKTVRHRSESVDDKAARDHPDAARDRT